MRFSIVTPSFEQSQWLRLCVASVADQGVEHEHIVQDAGSKDGTLGWLTTDARVRAFVESDAGMYDAINRGLRRATGDVLSYLNCDEQYLPGALAAVGAFFSTHPEVEVVFADTVVVDAEGGYLCHRRASVPQKHHSWVSGNLAILTCAAFFRRRLIEQRGLFFDASLRDVADAMWVLRLIEERVPMAVLPRITSSFTDTGDNMNLKPNAQREKREMLARAPAWARRARPLIVAHYRLRRLLAGHYWQAPFEFTLYTRTSPAARVPRRVDQPQFRWRHQPVSPLSAGE